MDDQSSEWVERVGQVVCRPAFVGAVAVLLVNDHLLKGAGVLPGWVTGKLSDVAGLFFFPVLLAVVAVAVVRPRHFRTVRRLAAGAAGATMVGFAAVNLSPALAGALAEVWGVLTVDPTDLACLPFAALGYAWFVRAVAEARPRVGRRWAQATMVLVAAAGSWATSKPEPVADGKIRNETDHSLEFVESDAEILYWRTVDDTQNRIAIDGDGDQVIAPEGYELRSVARDGRTAVLVDEETGGVYAYREEQAEPIELAAPEAGLEEAVVTPDGEFVAMTHRAGETTVRLAELATGEVRVIDEGLQAKTEQLGWDAESEALYLQLQADSTPTRRFSLESGEWTELEPGFVWSGMKVEREYMTAATRCEDDSGVYQLRDSSPTHGETYPGLEMVAEDGEGEAELLVDIEITEKLEEDVRYRTPIGEYTFVGGCEYVAFSMNPDNKVRVVGVESKTVGVISEGAQARPVPRDRPVVE